MIRLKANRTLRMRKNDEGAVGIGTLIVFIATILVAAVASAVLIDTSNNLQEKAQRTGNEATSQVATNLDVVKVVGQLIGAATDIDALNITIGLAPGAKTVDLSQVIVRLSNLETELRLNWSQIADPTTGFNVTEIRDPASTQTTATPVLSPGGLAVINIDLDSTHNNMVLTERLNIELELIPEVGAPVSADFRTPATYGTDNIFTLR